MPSDPESDDRGLTVEEVAENLDIDLDEERRVRYLARKWTIPREEARRLLEVQRHGE